MSKKKRSNKENITQQIGFRDEDVKAMGSKEDFVDGPINVVRLEGEIGGTTKIVYLFIGHYLNLMDQTKCASLYSRDIRNYMVDGFASTDKSNKKLDVFTTASTDYMTGFVKSGTTSEQILMSTFSINKTTDYHRGLLKLLARIYYDKGSPPFSNIRIHGNEMADYIYPSFYADPLSQIQYDLSVLEMNSWKLMGTIQKDEILSSLTKVSDYFNILSDAYKKAVRGDKSDNREKGAIIRLFHKMVHRVNSPDVKKVVNDILISAFEKEKEVKSLIKTLITYLEPLYKCFSRRRSDMEPATLIGSVFTESYGDSMKLLCSYKINIARCMYHMFSTVTSIHRAYFLRRLLDKSYITRGILYANYYIQILYTDTLIKQFGFKITHAAYKTVPSIRELNDKIKAATNLEEVSRLLLTDNMIQCSNLDGFPKNFD